MNARPSDNVRALLAMLILALMLVSGCAAMNRRPEALLPDRHVFHTGPFRIHTHRPINASDPIVAELDSLSRTVGKAIGEPQTAPGSVVDIYLLKDDASFRHYLKFFHPELPPRRAYFIATDNSRTIYTFMGEHLMEDLRHEATHALVNLTHPTLPLWLDEGLAESFEYPEGSSEPDTHISRFLADVQTGAVPDLARLEKITDVREMTPRDYRESWAWVQWGLAGPKPIRDAFDRYIRAASANPSAAVQGRPESLSRLWNEVAPQLNPQGTPMVAWLSREARSGTDDLAAAPRDPLLGRARLQNADATSDSPNASAKRHETAPPASRRPGFFRRLFGF